MSMLAALKGCYDRLADDDASGVAPFGYSEEKISFALILSTDGEFVDYRDLRQASGRKSIPQLMQVPQAIKRTVAIAPNFLWDKTSYALGIEREPDERTRREHEAFEALHVEALGRGRRRRFTGTARVHRARRSASARPAAGRPAGQQPGLSA